MHGNCHQAALSADGATGNTSLAFNGRHSPHTLDLALFHAGSQLCCACAASNSPHYDMSKFDFV
jgi:hypothetical protein